MKDNWLKASHLMLNQTYQKFTLTITSVAGLDHGRSYEDEKPIEGFILAFAETPKEFVIKPNAVNHRLIQAQLGESHEQWIGQPLTVFPVVGDWFKQPNTLGIRVWVDANKPRPKIAARLMGKPVIGFSVGSHSEHEYDQTA